MIKILTLDEAEQTILNRKSILKVEVSEKIRESIKNIFGEYHSPHEVVKIILNDIEENKDEAVKKWTKKIDDFEYDSSIEIPSSELKQSFSKINEDAIKTLKLAIKRLKIFHENQPINNWVTDKLGGQLGQIIRPIEKIGIYIPGGTAPLPSTLIHTAIPAIVAGVKEIVVMSPPPISDIIKAVLFLIHQEFNNIRLFQVGGVQAIGALTYGTETIPKVQKILGPGNIFVTLAKREVFGIVGIDGLAGPTEAMIIADRSASSSLIASDLLAQAEHDYLAIPILITNDKQLAENVQKEISEQIVKLSRKSIAEYSISEQGGIILVENLEKGFEVVNNFAPEHLSILTKDSLEKLNMVTSSGGVFLGESSCEVLGDYIAGPSHVMPTGGSALYNSPLNVLDFVKLISIVALDSKTVKNIASHAEEFAKAENLTAHAESARRRYQIND
ncbi:MAG: histidinol dehydrogenase [Candidatus Hodarchaeales archaeon]|jgi:histidinol dehydrogenase